MTEPQATALRMLSRQALHAATLGFEHPITGQPMHFDSPVPADIQGLIDALRPPAVKAAATRRTSRRER